MGKRTVALGFCGLIEFLEAYLIQKSAEAAPGDSRGRAIVSRSRKIKGISHGLDDKISWMSQSGDI